MSAPAIPNNLGPTLLLVAGLLLLPVGLGLPLLWISLARVRTWQGQPAFPRLHRALERLEAGWVRAPRINPLLPGQLSGD